MADPITFNCTSCGMPYKVAASYAGREFACKKCGARLVVPQLAQHTGFRVEPEVEMGSGTEVMRRTTASGRQVTVDPTRVFKRERETSQRMVAVGAEGKKKSGNGMLIGGIVAGVVLLGAVVAAVIMFTGTEEAATNSDGTTVSVETPESNEPTERDNHMARLEEGLDAAGLLALFKEAEGKVEDADLTVISQHLVRAVNAEDGGALSDEEVMSLADRLTEMKLGADTERLIMVVINRHRRADTKPETYIAAREQLGYSQLDFDTQLERARSLGATGVVEGMDEAVEELTQLQDRADDGWSTLADKVSFENAVESIDAAQATVDDIRKNDPFRFKLVTARLAFSKEKASQHGSWVSVARDPYVIFIQLLASEDQAAAEERLENALLAAEQFPEFFNSELRESLNLKRMLPSDLPADERENAPIVFKLFRSASYWRAYLKDHGYGDVDATRARTFTEPGNGHVSMVYDQEDPGRTTNLGKFIRALIDVSMYNYHPNAPTTHEEDENFQAYSSYFLNVYFHAAISMTNVDPQTMDYTFMYESRSAVDTLKRWLAPFSKDSRDLPTAMGGQVLGVRECVEWQSSDDLKQTILDKLAGLEGWTEADLRAAEASWLGTIAGAYLRGIYQFLFHYQQDGELKYRAKFMKFIRMDLAGEVDKGNPVAAFETALGLDETDWKQLESEFSAYQGG